MGERSSSQNSQGNQHRQRRQSGFAERVGQNLQRLIRQRLARKPGAYLIESELDELELSLPLALHGDAADPKHFASLLTRSIDAELDDAIERAATFRPGHAFCHRCASADCEHSMPPSCRHVFVGYAPTGIPRWVELAQYALDRGHADVDRLYEDPPAFLTLVHGPQELHGEMVQAFNRRNYELLGQMTAGFFRIPTRAAEGRGVLALSVQAAASRSGRGRRRYGLNVIGLAPSGDGLATLWERQNHLPWQRAVQWAQAALQTIDRRQNGRRQPKAMLQGRVEGILNGLARRLEREQRARGRRTQHAQQRHSSGARPTRKALDDAKAVGEDACFIDEREGTVVILGSRGRTHVFTADGQHVTSVRYSRDAVGRKTRTERWRLATPAERAAFLETLGGE